MAPYCPRDKACSPAWHPRPLSPLRPHCLLSPTLKIAQSLRSPPTHPSVVFPTAPSTWDPCPPRLLATAFSPLKASTSIPSSRQGMLALASLLPPVLTLAESSLGSPSSPGKGLGTQDRATPQGQLGTPSFPGDGQRLAHPSAPGDPAYLSRQLTSGSPLQGQFDFYLPGPAPGNPSNSRLKPWAATADDKPSCSSHLQHLL